MSFAGRAVLAAVVGVVVGCSGSNPGADAARAPDGGKALSPPSGPAGSDGGVDGTRGGPTEPGGHVRGPAGCAALAADRGVDVDGYHTDRYTWFDADCKERTAALVHNDRADPGGSFGGFLRELTYDAGGVRRRVRGTGAEGYNGWGYVTGHYELTNVPPSSAGTWTVWSGSRAGNHRVVLAGAHHAIHEFKVRMKILLPKGPSAPPVEGGVDATVHWLFATGRSHPIYAVTLDTSSAPPNAIKADTRAPYGDVTWDGIDDNSGPVEGLGWGDAFRFRTTGAGPVSPSSAWDYSEPNVVPHVRMWSKANAEMGAVQTTTFAQQVAGGDYGDGLLEVACWGKTSATASDSGCHDAGNVMPADWLWPFQLNQYAYGSLPSSKRIAWGATFGAVGQEEVTTFGRTVRGYPRLSYAVHAVLGLHTDAPVDAAIGEVEALAGAKVTASRGTIPTSGLGGVGRTDTVDWPTPGYDPRYGVLAIDAADGAATLTVETARSLRDPVLTIRGFTGTAPARVVLDGATLVVDTDYFASVDPATKTLWITLHRTLAPRFTLSVE